MPKVTLIKPGTGSTQWGTNVGQNWTDVENTFKEALCQREVFEITDDFLRWSKGIAFVGTVRGQNSGDLCTRRQQC